MHKTEENKHQAHSGPSLAGMVSGGILGAMLAYIFMPNVAGLIAGAIIGALLTRPRADNDEI